MRITGGKAKGIKLKVPKGDGTRPATDQVREAVFSSLQGMVGEDGVFLDLFAGTGAYGLECISRFGLKGTFIENNSTATSIIKDNLKSIKKSIGDFDKEIKVLKEDVFKHSFEEEEYEIVFMDPPYPIIDKIFEKGLWDGVGKRAEIVVLEMPSGRELPEHENLVLKKHLGKKGKGKPSVGIYIKKT